MKYIKNFNTKEEAIGEYETPLVCTIKNVFGKALCVPASLGDKVEIDRIDDDFIQIKNVISYFKFDTTPLDSTYKLK